MKTSVLIGGKKKFLNLRMRAHMGDLASVPIVCEQFFYTVFRDPAHFYHFIVP